MKLGRATPHQGGKGHPLCQGGKGHPHIKVGGVTQYVKMGGVTPTSRWEEPHPRQGGKGQPLCQERDTGEVNTQLGTEA